MEFASPKPNYINPESRAGLIVAINATAASVAAVFVSMRILARIWILRSVGWDDVAAAVATFLLITSCVLSSVASKYGFGLHIWDIKPELITPQLKLGLFVGVLYNPSMMAIKLSVLFFYLRIFSAPAFRKMVYITMAFTIAITITFTLGNVLKCTPVSFYWDRSITGGKCIDLTLFIYLNAALSIVTDLWIWALPIPILKNLELNRRKKFALFFVFSLGLFACVASILRLRVLSDAATYSDPTWGNVGINVWSQIELSTSITCACLPPMRPLLSRTFQGIFGSNQGTYGNSSQQVRSQNIYGLRSLQKNVVPEDSLVPRGSEEEILAHIEIGSTTDIEAGVIRKTIDVSVNSEQR